MLYIWHSDEKNLRVTFCPKLLRCQEYHFLCERSVKPRTKTRMKFLLWSKIIEFNWLRKDHLKTTLVGCCDMLLVIVFSIETIQPIEGLRVFQTSSVLWCLIFYNTTKKGNRFIEQFKVFGMAAMPFPCNGILHIPGSKHKPHLIDINKAV